MDLKTRKNKKSYTILDIYHSFSKDEENDGIEVDYLRFKRILDKFNENVLNTLLDKSEGFKMPHGLGYIRIVKYKPKGLTGKSLSKDYKASADLNKQIYHLNEHSNGYKYRLFWSKLPRTFSDKYKYNLSLVRANKRKLAQLIFNKKDYINIDDIQIYKM